MADDVLILKTSGVPLYAKCFGGQTCKNHPDHALQSGFLAALFSFSKEAFSSNGVKSVIFEDFKHLNDTHRTFVEKYHPVINSPVYDTNLFADFDQDLVKLDVVTNNAKKDLPLEKIPFWKKIFARKK
ncbi:MAG: hypothetical protein ACTSPC_09075 [Candidatus Heimdallarchaeota archaeon]